LRDVSFHRVWEPSGFRSKSDFDPITDRQQFQRICQRFEYRHGSSSKGVLELHCSNVYLGIRLARAAPPSPILTQDSGADTFCRDIDFLPYGFHAKPKLMKVSMKLLAMLLASVILASGCVAPPHKINWRETTIVDGVRTPPIFSLIPFSLSVE
jgi:hypothetical protein